MASLKAKNSVDTVPTKKVIELRKQNDELQVELDRDKKRYTDLTGKYEQLEEEHVLIKAQLTTDKEKLQTTLNSTRSQLHDIDSDLSKLRKEKLDLSKKLTEQQNKVKDFESINVRSVTVEHEKNRLKVQLEDREKDFERLKDENEMNKDVCMQMKREVYSVLSILRYVLY